MGDWAKAKRAAIVKTFEAGSGDMRGDVQPVSIWRRTTDGRDPDIELELVQAGTVLRVTVKRARYDLDDVVRIFAIAFLDELTRHHYQRRARTVAFTGVLGERELGYPDPE